jgi:hypothetical protein
MAICPRPGRRRPGRRLMVRGNLEAALALTGANVTSVGSPGGICALLTSELPPRVVSLWGRHSSRSGPVEQRRAVCIGVDAHVGRPRTGFKGRPQGRPAPDDVGRTLVLTGPECSQDGPNGARHGQITRAPGPPTEPILVPAGAPLCSSPSRLLRRPPVSELPAGRQPDLTGRGRILQYPDQEQLALVDSRA